MKEISRTYAELSALVSITDEVCFFLRQWYYGSEYYVKTTYSVT